MNLAEENDLHLANIPPGVTDWRDITPSVQPGAKGVATVRARQLGGVCLRRIEYGPGYLADHWCGKGHVVHLLSGDLTTEHQDGSRYAVAPGATYHVGGDHPSPHRVRSQAGAVALVLD